MALLELPIPPYRLYRYRSLTRTKKSISQEIASIRENYLWSSNYTTMNDPMEGFYQPSESLETDERRKNIYRSILASKTNFGLVSFADTHDDILMWAHYAGNYSGICVRYKTDVLLSGLPDQVRLVRVSYTKGLPRLSQEDAADINVAARKILSQKNADWTYEREWRILGPKGKLNINGSETAVTRIYFGSAVNSEHVRCVRTELASLPIKFFRMNIEGYRHKWREIEAD